MSDIEGSLQQRPPLVSVVTPAYNAMPYIEETVLSVQRQDYPRIEHIVMDGGSTDGTLEFLQQQPQLIWTSEEDRGQSHALNKGFKKANGEIIGWLNADDLYESGAISAAVHFLSENADVDIVYGDLRIINESSEFVGLSASRAFNLEQLLVSNYVNQPTVFMRRNILTRFNGVDEQLHYTMDRELWLRAGMAGARMQYLKGVILASFRLCAGTKSFDDTPQFRIEWAKVLEALAVDEIERPDFWQAREAALRKTRSQYHLARMTQAFERKERMSGLGELVQAIRQDITLMLNRGSWKFAAMAIFGVKPDRMRRFRKNRACTRSSDRS